MIVGIRIRDEKTPTDILLTGAWATMVSSHNNLADAIMAGDVAAIERLATRIVVAAKVVQAIG